MQRLDQVIARIAQFPRQVLRIDVSQPAVDSSRQLAASISLSSAGSEPVYVRNPAALAGAADGWLSVHVWSDQTAGAELLTFKAAAVEGPLMEQPTLTILPGKPVTYRVRVPLAVSAGAYVFRVSYANFARSAEGQALVYGELLSNTLTVYVP